jgi:Flp pilus assembly protein TadD
MTSRGWLSRITGGKLVPELGREGSQPPSLTNPPADQVKLLEAAASRLNDDIDKCPADPALHNRLGLIYLSLGDNQHALDHFQKAVSLSHLGITAISDKIASLRSRGQNKEASAALVDALKLDVELSAAHSNLARLYEKRAEHDKVIAELDLLNREGLLFDNSMTGKAEPGKPTLINAEAARHLARAEALFQSRQLPAAADEYRRVLAVDPNVAMAHHHLGTILAMTNQSGPALDELQMAAKLDPDSPEVLSDLGFAYQTLGFSEQACKSYEQSLSLEPRQTEAAINLSNIYCATGRMPDAIGVLSQAVQNNPSSARAHNNLATLYSLDGKLTPALYEFQKALSLEPNMASAHYGLGSVMLQNKQYSASIREFKQALALQPNLTQAQVKIDEAYRKSGLISGVAQAIN